jgi:beta-lactamase regulating signal transducer with metallopeptidase domain/biopolymer transport protein ExbD
MNPLPTSADWLHAFGALGLEIAVLLAVAGLLQTRMPSPRWRRGVWMMAFGAVTVLAVVSMTGLDRRVLASLVRKSNVEPQFVVRVASASKAAPIWFADGSETAAPGFDHVAPAGPSGMAGSGDRWPAWLWLIGTLVVGLRVSLPRLWLAFVCRRHAAEDPGVYRERARALAGRIGLRRAVRLVSSPRLVSPIAFGVFRPSVGLPVDFRNRHTPAEQDAMLAHEFAHLAARDPFWLALADTLATLLWWHPLVWWARGQFRAASEMAADEASLLVEGGPQVLAGCLVALAGRWQQRGVLGLLGVAGFRSGLGRRVERLLHLEATGRRMKRRVWPAFLIAMGGGVALVVALAAAGWFFPARAQSPMTLLALVDQAFTATPEPTPAAASETATPGQRTNTVTILVSDDGRVLLNRREQSMEKLGVELKSIEAQARGPSLIQITAHPETPHQRMNEILEACREAGLAQVVVQVTDSSLIHSSGSLAASPSPAAVSEPPSSLWTPAVPIESSLPPDTRQTLLQKLDRIVLEKLAWPSNDMPLNEVMNFLREQVRIHDPDQSGVNLIYGEQLSPGASKVDLPEPGDIRVRLSLALERVRLRQLLEAIVQTAEPAIKFSVTDWGVVFSPVSVDGQELYARIYRVNPEAFHRGLERGVSGASPGPGDEETTDSLPGAPLGENAGDLKGSLVHLLRPGGIPFRTSTNSTAQLLDKVRRFFRDAGVDLSQTRAQEYSGSKSVFYSDRAGLLYVRATQQDLAKIETVLHALNQGPPMVTIEAKFVEITQRDGKPFDLDAFLGQQGIGGITNLAIPTNPPVTVTGIMGDSQFRNAAAASRTGRTDLGAALAKAAAAWQGDQVGSSGRQTTNTEGVRVTSSQGAGLTGILTAEQARTVLQELEQRGGVEVLSVPKVTTLSGRQAQIQAVTFQSVVASGVDLAALRRAGIPDATNSSKDSLTQQIPVGPTLDVTPEVAGDLRSIVLTVCPSVMEFLGYDEPPKHGKARVEESRQSAQVALPLPRFRVRQMHTQARVSDGQTLMLAGMPVEDVERTVDRVSVLGDLPLVGKLFRSETSRIIRKHLLVFVTPTLIDPAGNPIHSTGNPSATRATAPSP